MIVQPIRLKMSYGCNNKGFYGIIRITNIFNEYSYLYKENVKIQKYFQKSKNISKIVKNALKTPINHML